jgi:hypothetical protein
MKFLLLLIACMFLIPDFAMSLEETSKSSVMIPVSINRQISEHFQVDIITVSDHQTIFMRAAQLIETIRKINKTPPNELTNLRQETVTLEQLSKMGFYCNFDEEKVEIEISMPVDRNKPDSLSIAAVQDTFREGESITAAKYSGFLNTSLTAGFRRDQQSTTYADLSSARFDGVLNANGYVLEASGTQAERSPFQRDDVRVTKEISLLGGMRVSAGDLFYPVLGYQTYRKMGGVSAYTTRTQRQSFLSSRTAQKQIEVRQPSTLTFFVNEQPVATRKVLPGLYDISDIPMTAGVNRIRVSVQADGSGQREDVVFDDYFSDYGIKVGQEDLALALGEKSQDLNGSRSYSSNNQTFLLNHRYDLSNWFSLSEYYEGDQNSRLAGLIEAFHVVGGYIQFDTALSAAAASYGTGARISYFKTRPDEMYILKGDRYNLNLEKKSSSFVIIDAAAPIGETDVSAAYTFPAWQKYSFGLGGSLGVTDDSGSMTYSYSSNISRAIGSFYVTLNAGERYTSISPAELTVGLSLNWSPGERSYYANTQQVGAQNTSHLEVNTSRDQDVKGSVTQTVDGRTRGIQTQVTGVTNRNEMTFSGNRTEELASGSYVEHFSFNTRFALAFAGTKTAIGRPITDSFFLTDTNHNDRQYRLETWGRNSTTGPMGEALIGFDSYQNDTAKVAEGDPYGHEFDNAGVFNVQKSWRNGYLLKIKKSVSPTVISILAPDLETIKNTTMTLRNVETGETAEFFVSSDGEIFVESIECGEYEFTVGRYTGHFVLDMTGGRRDLDLN